MDSDAGDRPGPRTRRPRALVPVVLSKSGIPVTKKFRIAWINGRAMKRVLITEFAPEYAGWTIEQKATVARVSERRYRKILRDPMFLLERRGAYLAFRKEGDVEADVILRRAMREHPMYAVGWHKVRALRPDLEGEHRTADQFAIVMQYLEGDDGALEAGDGAAGDDAPAGGAADGELAGEGDDLAHGLVPAGGAGGRGAPEHG